VSSSAQCYFVKLTTAASYSIPDGFRFRGLYTIGCIIFLFNILLFVFNTIVISIRFYFWPETFKDSFLHPTESLFIPSVIISIGTILVNITQYGVGDQTGSWLDHVMIVLFWIYCGIAVAFSFTIYLVM
jgi:tellurite resistance protein TehA-like permease